MAVHQGMAPHAGDQVSAEHRKKVEELFKAAIDLRGRHRAAYLAERCHADVVLRRDVDRLLAAHEAHTDVDFGRTPDLSGRPEPGEQVGDRIGAYKLLSLIGQGAFGDVYLAEQTEPMRRTVALKIVKLGMDTKEVVARFEAERQALALMEHPHIAKVHDAGATATGRPYFVMEHVPGVPVTTYCDERRLPIRERLRLFLTICDAIQHAHQKGIIHRDIKPSNILVKIVGDRPVLKVIDFGIATATGYSLTERTLFTDRGQLIGTPEYMSPEQAQVSAHNVDTRTDIYALGVILYELLSGLLPFDRSVLRSGTIDQVQAKIREVQPPKPSTRLGAPYFDLKTSAQLRRTNPQALRRRLRGELDWITMKAMEKDRSRRYATASELAADVQRHLDHQPVLAGPPSTAYRVRKFVRRNRTVVIATLLVLAALTGGTVAMAFGFLEARSAERELINERDRLRRAVSVALSVILEGLASSEADPAREVIDNVYWALTATFGTPNSGDEEAKRRIVEFVQAGRHLRDGQLEEAERILDPLKEWVDEQFESPVNVASVLIGEMQASTKMALGKFAEAEPIAKEAFWGYYRLYGGEAPVTERARDRLGDLYEAWGERQRAAAWREELSRRLPGKEPPG